MSKDIIKADSQQTEEVVVETTVVETPQVEETPKTFTQDEVNEIISKRVNKINTELTNVKTELETFKGTDHNTKVDTVLGKLNISKKWSDDFKAIAGNFKGMETDEILSKATEMKQTGKYDIMFNKGNSGIIKTIHKNDEPKKPGSGAITPAMGLGWFNKNKKT